MSIRSIKGSSIKGTNTLDKAQVDSFECGYVVLAGGSGGGGGRIGNAAYSGDITMVVVEAQVAITQM